MKKKLGISLVIIGTVLLVAALSLILYNRIQDKQYSEAASTALDDVKKLIPGLSDSVGGNIPTARPDGSATITPEITQPGILDEYIQDEETIVESDGIRYLGVISLPTIEIELPVTADCNNANMKFAACRYEGTVAGSDLIICAHNLPSFFSKLSKMNSGDEIVFVDGDGEYHYYEVVEISTMGGYEVDKMKEGSEEWDITLFTCTYGGANRVTVRAVEILQ